MLASRDAHDSLEGRWMAAIPFDVASLISSQLQQSDVLEFMSVCRMWRQLLPHHTVDVWRSVQLDFTKGHLYHERLQECLGPHVRQTVIKRCATESKVYGFLSMILDRGCRYLEYLEFNQCQMVDLGIFLPLLSEFSSLKEIVFDCQLNALSLHDLLTSCPSSLVRFAYIAKSAYMSSTAAPPAFTTDATLQQHSTNITHLHLGGTCKDVDGHSGLAMVLRRCPHLQYLCASHDWFLSIPQDHVLADWLSDKCPYLRHFECTDRDDILSSSKTWSSRSGGTGLCTLILVDSCAWAERMIVEQPHQTMSLIERHQHSLEQLELVVYDPFGMMQHLDDFGMIQCCDKLRVFECIGINCDPDLLAYFLGQCCPVLEQLTLGTCDMPILTLDLMESIRQRLPRLLKLSLSQLEPEIMEDGGIDTDYLVFFFESLSCRQRLLHVEIPVVKSVAVLHAAVVNLLVLEKVVIVAYELTDDRICQFVQSMIIQQRRRQQKVQEISIKRAQRLSMNTLTLLSDLDHLMRLNVELCSDLSMQGIEIFASKKSDRIQCITLDGCHIHNNEPSTVLDDIQQKLGDRLQIHSRARHMCQ